MPPPDLNFAAPAVDRFGLDRPFALLVAGGAAHRPEKRWPAESYAVLARQLAFGKSFGSVVDPGATSNSLNASNA